jgi:hypothetical protein
VKSHVLKVVSTIKCYGVCLSILKMMINILLHSTGQCLQTRGRQYQHQVSTQGLLVLNVT